MSYHAIVIPVMIASPGDVHEEREATREIIQSWNFINAAVLGIVLMPVGWETHLSPELGDRPQEFINNKLLKDCDLLVGIFWTRIGTPTGESKSGTVEEIEKHIEAKKPAMLYFSSKPVTPESIDPKQYNELKSFKKKCHEMGLVEKFDNINEFKDKFSKQLQINLNQNSYLKKIMSDSKNRLINDNNEDKIALPGFNLSLEATVLLKEASKDQGGNILKLASLGGRRIQTNKKSYGSRNGRESARWEYALTQLVEAKYVIARGSKGEVYEITHKGYLLADKLPDII